MLKAIREWWASSLKPGLEPTEFKRTFPTCPICGSDSGYDGTIINLWLDFTYNMGQYVKCRSCGAVWGLFTKGPIWNMELRYVLLKPDKDMRAISLVGKEGSMTHVGNPFKAWKAPLEQKILSVIAMVVWAINIAIITTLILEYVVRTVVMPLLFP